MAEACSGVGGQRLLGVGGCGLLRIWWQRPVKELMAEVCSGVGG